MVLFSDCLYCTLRYIGAWSTWDSVNCNALFLFSPNSNRRYICTVLANFPQPYPSSLSESIPANKHRRPTTQTISAGNTRKRMIRLALRKCYLSNRNMGPATWFVTPNPPDLIIPWEVVRNDKPLDKRVPLLQTPWLTGRDLVGVEPHVWRHDLGLSKDAGVGLFACKLNSTCRVHLEVIQRVSSEDAASGWGGGGSRSRSRGVIIPTAAAGWWSVDHDVNHHNHGNDDQNGDCDALVHCN